MNRADVSKLLHLIRALSPAFTAEPATGDAWAELLADIPTADAVQAVKAHFATGGPWIGVADIRRRVLAARGLLPPDPEAAYEQAVRMNRWFNCRTGPEPAIHPTAMAAGRAIGWLTFDGPEGIAHRRFVESYTPKVAAAIEQALTTPMAALETEVHAPKALPGGLGVEAARQAAEAGEMSTFRKAEDLRHRTSGGLARLGDAIATLGNDARFLLPPGIRLDSEFGQAALRHKLRDYGADRDPDEAMRQARLEISRHSTSDLAATENAAKAAALQALKNMIEEESA